MAPPEAAREQDRQRDGQAVGSLKYNLRTVRAYLLREDFQRFWEYMSPAWAGKFLDEWTARVMRSCLEPMKKVARSTESSAVDPELVPSAGRGFGWSCGGSEQQSETHTRKSYGFEHPMWRTGFVTQSGTSPRGRTHPQILLRRLVLFKRHLPYHESDHVLNIAFNILAEGERIEHLELRRNNQVYCSTPWATAPSPTRPPPGDFCRHTSPRPHVVTLMDAINETRLRVWSEQPPEFFKEAILDVDGTIVGTDAECKQGVDIASNGVWSYHPLVVSLANTAEPLFLVNRSGNRPSHERADVFLNKAIDSVVGLAFGGSRLAVTPLYADQHLDRWDDAGDVRFIFGSTTIALKARADALPPGATASWSDRRGTIARPCRVNNPTGEAGDRQRAGVRDDPRA